MRLERTEVVGKVRQLVGGHGVSLRIVAASLVLPEHIGGPNLLETVGKAASRGTTAAEVWRVRRRTHESDYRQWSAQSRPSRAAEFRLTRPGPFCRAISA